MCRVHRGGTIGVGAILAVVALAAPGSASALTTRSASDSGSSGVLEAAARCKDGEHVVSGGFKSPEANYAPVSRARRGNRWTVTLFGGNTLTVYAYCSDGPGVSGHSAKENVAPEDGDGTMGKAAASCGSNESLVSGGYETVGAEPGTADLNPFKSYRSGDRTWKVSVFSDADAISPLKVFAYCQDVDVRVRSAVSDPIPDSTSDSATAKCHQGEELLSGGYKTTPKSDWENITGPDFFYYRSFRSGRREWTASARNYSSFEQGTITTFAYCKA